MLRVYVAPDCPGSALAVRLVEQVRGKYPHMPLEVVDIADPKAVIPSRVFGTPMYAWEDQVVFLGNPSEAVLLAWVKELL